MSPQELLGRGIYQCKAYLMISSDAQRSCLAKFCKYVATNEIRIGLVLSLLNGKIQ